MSDEAAIFEPAVNCNFVAGLYCKFVDCGPGDNGL
jgi:hypothetical protein